MRIKQEEEKRRLEEERAKREEEERLRRAEEEAREAERLAKIEKQAEITRAREAEIERKVRRGETKGQGNNQMERKWRTSSCIRKASRNVMASSC